MGATAEKTEGQTEQPLKSEQADKSEPKVTTPKAEAKPKKPARPEPVTFTTLKEGAKVDAYHPRLHDKVSRATVQRDLGQADTYVRIKFADGEPKDTGGVVTTHRQNVYPVKGNASKGKGQSKAQPAPKAEAAAPAA